MLSKPPGGLAASEGAAVCWDRKLGWISSLVVKCLPSTGKALSSISRIHRLPSTERKHLQKTTRVVCGDPDSDSTQLGLSLLMEWLQGTQLWDLSKHHRKPSLSAPLSLLPGWQAQPPFPRAYSPVPQCQEVINPALGPGPLVLRLSKVLPWEHLGGHADHRRPFFLVVTQGSSARPLVGAPLW